MKIQTDYETDLTLAVFRTPQAAEHGLQELARAGVHPDRVDRLPLAPGRYDVTDTSGTDEVSGLLRGAEIGAPAGAVVGLGVAATMLGPSPEAMLGIAGAGAVAGGVLGAFEGAVLRARFDDDVAEVHQVPDDDPEELLILYTCGIDGTTARARQLLKTAGATAFLDPSTFEIPESA